MNPKRSKTAYNSKQAAEPGAAARKQRPAPPMGTTPVAPATPGRGMLMLQCHGPRPTSTTMPVAGRGAGGRQLHTEKEFGGAPPSCTRSNPSSADAQATGGGADRQRVHRHLSFVVWEIDFSC